MRLSRFFSRHGGRMMYLYSLFSESKNNVYAFGPNAKTAVALQIWDTEKSTRKGERGAIHMLAARVYPLQVTQNLMCKHWFNTFTNSVPMVPMSYRVAAVVVWLAAKQPVINIRLSASIRSIYVPLKAASKSIGLKNATALKCGCDGGQGIQLGAVVLERKYEQHHFAGVLLE